MKAIKTQYHGPTNKRGSRYSATTGEKGQRVWLKDWGGADANEAHAMAARLLVEKFLTYVKKPVDLIGGGFPDGTMVWVFADSPDRTMRRFEIRFIARVHGAQGVIERQPDMQVFAAGSCEARAKAIEQAITERNLEHVTILQCWEIKR